MKLLYLLLAGILTLPIVTPGYYRRKNWAGACACLALSVPAYFIGTAVPMVGGPVAAILLGMVLGTFVKLPRGMGPGVKATSKRLLQGAIVLFGFQMDLSAVLRFGSQGLVLILTVITTALLVAFFVGRWLKVDGQTATLIGVGTAICGGSAIAATAPVIKADEGKVATAISTIFIFNALAAFLFPLLGRALGFDDTTFGMWAGSAVNDTSSVVAAGFAFSDTAGEIATVVKLVRTLMIIPVTLILALAQARRDKGQAEARGIGGIFPWFVLGFLAACLINTAGIFPAAMTAFWGKVGKYVIIVAMAAIGMGANLKDLLRHGKRPVLLGLCCWVCVALMSAFMVTS